MYPGSLSKSLRHPTEALFFPTFWLSLPTIIGGMKIYGVPHTGPWLIITLRILFWIYCACTMLVAICRSARDCLVALIVADRQGSMGSPASMSGAAWGVGRIAVVVNGRNNSPIAK
jgi:hypothetical protein